MSRATIDRSNGITELSALTRINWPQSSPSRTTQRTTQVGTVAQLKTLPDDAHLILKGNIVRNVQGDKYEFKDATGSVELEIDRKYWNGQNVKPENTVKLIVEVDKDLLKTEYEVDAPVEVLK